MEIHGPETGSPRVPRNRRALQRGKRGAADDVRGSSQTPARSAESDSTVGRAPAGPVPGGFVGFAGASPEQLKRRLLLAGRVYGFLRALASSRRLAGRSGGRTHSLRAQPPRQTEVPTSLEQFFSCRRFREFGETKSSFREQRKPQLPLLPALRGSTTAQSVRSACAMKYVAVWSGFCG